MTKESTRQALEGLLNDPKAAAQVAEGDFSAMADHELTDAERALLKAAAADIDSSDVSGFGFRTGETSQGITLDNGIKHSITLDNGLKYGAGIRGAFDYLGLRD